MTKPIEEAIDSKSLCDLVVEGMQEKKASDIVVMDLRSIRHAVADFFIICSGTSDTQIDAIADSIEEHVRKISSEKPWRKEGQANREWILIDYVNVVAHVFNNEKRAFYGLEELWGDAKIQTIDSQN